MYELVTVLMVWISGLTGLLPSDLPTIVRMDALTMELQATSGTAPTGHMLAYYDPRTRVIYLRQDWSPHSPLDVSVLVHELVHVMQVDSGLAKRAVCKAQLEPQAYEIQDKWLESQNRKDLSQTDRVALLFDAFCGDAR